MRLVVLAALALATIGCSEAPPIAPRDDAPSSVQPKTAPPVQQRPSLPPEPPPPVAEKAHEVPGLEAQLRENVAFAGMWQQGHDNERDLLLTAISELFAEGGFTGPLRDALDRQPDIKAAAILLFRIHARRGAFPDAFTQSFLKRLAELRSEQGLGLWRPLVKGSAPYDITALAAWLHRDRPEYIRERINARRHGPMGWLNTEQPRPRAYLIQEKAALEWLARLTSLTPDEQSRLAYLQLPGVGERLTLGKFAYVVTEAEASLSVGRRPTKERAGDGAIFIIVHYTVENLGNTTARVLADGLQLVDAGGRQFSPSSRANTALAMSKKGKDLILSEVQPGLKRILTTVFEVPVAVADQPLRLAIAEKGLGLNQAVVAFRVR